MPVYRPSELTSFLQDLGTKAKKGLSQNFLIDANILNKILHLADVQAGDTVLEIGPGPGALTEALLEQGATVIAVEKDPLFAHSLMRLQTNDQRLTIFEADILDFPVQEVIQKGPVKLIANLPYHLTTPILTRFVALFPLFSTLTVMVQEEVGRRFCAKAGSKEYSSISVFLQSYADVSYGFKVGRNCFLPSPKVDSAIVFFSLKEPPKIDLKAFFQMTQTAFQQRRKMLKVSLRDLYDQDLIMHALKEMRLDPMSRPETLSKDQFIELFTRLEPQERADRDKRNAC